MENNIVWIADIICKDNDSVIFRKFRVFSTEKNATDWAIKKIDKFTLEDQFDDTFEWEVYALTIDQPNA